MFEGWARVPHTILARDRVSWAIGISGKSNRSEDGASLRLEQLLHKSTSIAADVCCLASPLHHLRPRNHPREVRLLRRQ